MVVIEVAVTLCTVYIERLFFYNFDLSQKIRLLLRPLRNSCFHASLLVFVEIVGSRYSWLLVCLNSLVHTRLGINT